MRGNYPDGRMRGSYPIYGSAAAAAAGPPLTNMALWFKADEGVFQDTAMTTAATANGAEVKGWQDFSGNARHATWASGAVPTLVAGVANGKPSVIGNSGVLGWASAFAPSIAEFFWVFRPPTDDPAMFLGGSATMGNSNLLFSRGTQIAMLNNPNADAWSLFTAVNGTNVVRLNHLWFEASVSVNFDVNDGSDNTTFGAGQVGLNLNQMGSGGGTYAWIGELLEVVGYTGNLSAGDRTSARAYFNAKYAIY